MHAIPISCLTSLLSCRFGCSKWAGEVLLRQMHVDFNIPASIFRCGMLLLALQVLPFTRTGCMAQNNTLHDSSALYACLWLSARRSTQ